MKYEHSNKSIPIIVYVAVSLILVLLTIFLPKEVYSDMEEKFLATFPEFSNESVVNKLYSNSTEDYFLEHFVFKDIFISSRTAMLTSMGQNEINGVFITKTAFYKNIKTSSTVISDKNTQSIEDFSYLYPNNTVSLAIIPSATEIYSDVLPNDPLILQQDVFIDSLYDSLRYTSYIDVYSSLITGKSKKIFYNTDTMWTSQGAYIGYTAIAKGLNVTPYTKDFFDIEYIYNDYKGDLYNILKLDLVSEDSIELYKASIIDTMTVKVTKYISGELVEFPSIYFKDSLESSTPLDIFMGSDVAYTQINTSIESEQELLIFSDDMSDSLMQFLILHYGKITVVDLSKLDKTTANHISINSNTVVLFLYSVENFILDNTIFESLSLI